MKKIALLATVALIVGLFSTQALAYRGGHGYRADAPRYAQNAPTEAQVEAFKKFYEATTDLRNKLRADRAEMAALMRADNPDPAKVRALTESMNETRGTMQAKAEEMGIEAGPGYGFGRGGRGPGYYGDCPWYDEGNTGRDDYGRGKGRGHGRGMGRW